MSYCQPAMVSRLPSIIVVQWPYSMRLAVAIWQQRAQGQQKCNCTSRWGSRASTFKARSWAFQSHEAPCWPQGSPTCSPQVAPKAAASKLDGGIFRRGSCLRESCISSSFGDVSWLVLTSFIFTPSVVKVPKKFSSEAVFLFLPF